ncbi:MAG: glycerol-3-phosphate dehydrogenase subunit GlpB [Propionibacteriaceae bacterium]|nr:glycerol-3-phosphate dehydrogenase subunit GlpB [Propionibacteriaceae bacterium]
MTDTVVIGSGLAGLVAAIRLALGGQQVTLLTFGTGGTQLGQGTIDVLGYTSDDPDDPSVHWPFDELPRYAGAHPRHPYARLSADQVRRAVDWLATLVPDLLIPGDGRNHVVPTAVGAMRPTYLVQPSMVWPDPTSVAVVGPRQIKDFYPEMTAANLEKTAEVTATGYHIDLPTRRGEAESAPVVYATALDDEQFRLGFATEVARVIGDEEVVCLPAILGLKADTSWRIAKIIGRPVVETLMPPPSIPGMRLNEALLAIAKEAGVRLITGSKVVGFEGASGQVTAVTLRQAGRDQAYPANSFVYAGGGFESGSLSMDSYGEVTETLFGLPLPGADQPRLITGNYWKDQKLFSLGVDVDKTMRPVNATGQAIYNNLYAVGGLLAGAIRWTEKSGDAIAVASAVQASDSIVGKETNV